MVTTGYAVWPKVLSAAIEKQSTHRVSEWRIKYKLIE